VSTTSALLTGIAELLDTANAGTWDPTGTYTDNTDGAIIIGPRLPETPSDAIGIAPYGVSDDPGLNDGLIGIQFRLRGTRDSESVLDRNDAIFDALHGMHDTTVGGVYVVLLWRQSFLPLPADENDRHQLTANYYARITRPNQFRTD
jgi:hypothetical protein